MITASIRSMDAVAWVRKYLVAASVDRGLGLIIRIGIMENIFISSPIQISSQWELIIVIIVPRNRLSRMMVKIIGFISMGRL